jgi:hypothetical protein
MFDRCQTAFEGFWSFPAGSLPRYRFWSSAVFKYMRIRDFFGGSVSKNFYPVFSRTAGKGEAAEPRPLFQGKFALARRGDAE